MRKQTERWTECAYLVISYIVIFSIWNEKFTSKWLLIPKLLLLIESRLLKWGTFLYNTLSMKRKMCAFIA